MNDWEQAANSQAASAGVNERLIRGLRDVSHTMRSLRESRGGQRRIMMILEEMGGVCTQRELTARLGIQPGSASEVIAKLENAGCIARTISETDRRTADIALTEAGRALAAEARRDRTRRHEEMFSCLSPEEKAALLRLLEKLNGDWRIRYPGAGKCRGNHPGTRCTGGEQEG